MTPLTKREYLRQLVAGKNRWFRPLTTQEQALGFLGWHERGYLPHCDYPGLVQFVTFRLADCMPACRRGEWEHLLAIEEVREKRLKLEEYLDRGHGACQLRDPWIARLTEETLLHFHQRRYELLAWCVMPNHVHVLVHVWQEPLWQMVRGWKRHVAMSARTQERRSPTRREDAGGSPAPGRRPALQWQREYWDTYMRDEEQERRAIRYIESNPVKSCHCAGPRDWGYSSARFRDEYCRLGVAPGPGALSGNGDDAQPPSAGAPVADPARAEPQQPRAGSETGAPGQR